MATLTDNTHKSEPVSSKSGQSGPVKNNPAGKRAAGWPKLLAMLAGVTAIGLALHRNLFARLAYPPVKDQQGFLIAAKDFAERFVFEWRTPLYSAWLGLFYILTGNNLEKTFYVERIVAVILLALLVALLGRLLFDTRTGLLLGIWTLNCKYLVLEDNGTHVIAAAVFVCSLLCLFLPNKRLRLPAALFVLFLSTLARQEMTLPFFCVIAYLLARAFWRWRTGQLSLRPLNIAGLKYWTIALAAAVALSLLVNARVQNRVENRVNLAFEQTFAINYVERKQLFDKYPQPWENSDEVVREAMPAFTSTEQTSPWAAMKQYPAEMRAHLVYNLKLAVRALPAAVLGLDQKILMLAAFLIYLGSYIIWRGKRDYLARWRSLPEETRRLMLVWMLGIFLLVPPSILFRVAARYYIQLVPVQMVLIIFCARFVMNRLKLFRDRAAR